MRGDEIGNNPLLRAGGPTKSGVFVKKGGEMMPRRFAHQVQNVGTVVFRRHLQLTSNMATHDTFEKPPVLLQQFQTQPRRDEEVLDSRNVGRPFQQTKVALLTVFHLRAGLGPETAWSGTGFFRLAGACIHVGTGTAKVLHHAGKIRMGRKRPDLFQNSSLASGGDDLPSLVQSRSHRRHSRRNIPGGRSRRSAPRPKPGSDGRRTWDGRAG